MIRDAKFEMGTETHKETNQLPLLACSFCIPKKILPISGCQSIKCEQTLGQEKKNTPPNSNIDTKNSHILKGVHLFQGPSTFGALGPSEGHRSPGYYHQPRGTPFAIQEASAQDDFQGNDLCVDSSCRERIHVPTLGKLKIIIFKRPLGREYLRLHLS